MRRGVAVALYAVVRRQRSTKIVFLQEESEMENVVAAVKKCRDDNAQLMFEDVYAKDYFGNLYLLSSKEAEEVNVRNLDCIITCLSAMASVTHNDSNQARA